MHIYISKDYWLSLSDQERRDLRRHLQQKLSRMTAADVEYIKQMEAGQ